MEWDVGKTCVVVMYHDEQKQKQGNINWKDLKLNV